MKFLRIKGDKRVVAAVAAVLVVLLIAGGVYAFFSRKDDAQETASTVSEQTIERISPEEIGLELELSEDETSVLVRINKTQDIKKIEYELSYMALPSERDIDEGIDEGEAIPRGAIGELKIERPGEPVEQEITLGTCSDVCHYDKGVSDIELTLKIEKTDKKIYEAKASAEN